MAKEIYIPFTRLRIDRFLALLVSLVLMFLLRPFLEGFVGIRLLMDIFISFVLISGTYAVSEKRSVFIAAVVLATPALLAHWAIYFVKNQAFILMGNVFGMLALAYIAIIILSHLFQANEVTADIIVGAICVYFLIGLMWASAYSVLEAFQPGSFQFSEGTGEGMSHFSYFSFVTLTTLGYGDATPISSAARSLSVLEAVMGQLYLAVLIARLVGMHIAQTKGDAS